MAAAPQWLQIRWNEIFFPAIEHLVTEEEVKALCETEIESWKLRPEIKSESTLRNPMTASRKEIEARLSGDLQAWALKYLAFPEEWYRKYNAPSQKQVEERLEHQKFLQDPDAIVAKAVILLASREWADIAIGIAVVTGRRPGEVLKTAIFTSKTRYSVVFEGQLKSRGTLPPYEIPTLCEAAIVIDALARLRVLLPTANQDVAVVTRTYSKLLQEAANRHFSALVPFRHGRDGLYGQLFRAVYPQIAVFWFAPKLINDAHYKATIQGHTQYFDQETEEARRSYGSRAHYDDYKIADRTGNIDGRQGIKLGMEGVELLEVFKPKPRRKPMTTPDTVEAEETQKKRSQNRPLTLTDEQLYNQVLALKTGLGHRSYNETVGLLLAAYQSQGAAAPLNTGELTPDRLVSGIEINLGTKEEPEMAALAPLIAQSLKANEDFSAFLIDALSKEVKFRAGVVRRHDGKDFSGLKTTQLKGIRDERATRERIRRAVIALADYNDAEERVRAERWFLNATTVHRLVGGRYPIITAWLTEHKAKVEALNTRHGLTDRANNKEYYVESVVTVPEEPPTEEQESLWDSLAVEVPEPVTD